MRLLQCEVCKGWYPCRGYHRNILYCQECNPARSGESLLQDAVQVEVTKDKILRGSAVRRKLLGKG